MTDDQRLYAYLEEGHVNSKSTMEFLQRNYPNVVLIFPTQPEEKGDAGPATDTRQGSVVLHPASRKAEGTDVP